MRGSPTHPTHYYFEWTGTIASSIKYYYSGSVRVAMRTGTGSGTNGLNWLLGDHLGSTSITADAGGTRIAELRCKPWGEVRYSYGTTPTDRRFTGQIEVTGGLYFFNARYFDSYLNRWIQPDEIIPDPGNPQSYDRYAYSFNNPINLIDPDGHSPAPVLPPCESCDKPIVNTSGWSNWQVTAAKVTCFFIGCNVDNKSNTIKTPTASEYYSNGIMLLAPIPGGDVASDAGIKVLFGQKSISNIFAHGEFAGMPIDEVASGLKSGIFSPDQLPLQVINREGATYTLNNRSLMALRLAGMEPTKLIDVTGNTTFESRLTERLLEIGNKITEDFLPRIRGRH